MLLNKKIKNVVLLMAVLLCIASSVLSVKAMYVVNVPTSWDNKTIFEPYWNGNVNYTYTDLRFKNSYSYTENCEHTTTAVQAILGIDIYHYTRTYTTW